MAEDTVYTLVPSMNSGRYALDDPEHGRDITSGTNLAIRLGGQWIEGSVEYAGDRYVNMGMQHGGEPPRLPRVLDGYYFIANDGTMCGLCTGMSVRLR